MACRWCQVMKMECQWWVFGLVKKGMEWQYWRSKSKKVLKNILWERHWIILHQEFSRWIWKTISSLWWRNVCRKLEARVPCLGLRTNSKLMKFQINQLKKKETFLTFVMRVFLCKSGGPDIQPVFLSTREWEPNEYYWSKLARLMNILKDTVDEVFIL